MTTPATPAKTQTKTERICALAREAAAKCSQAAREFDKSAHPVEHYDFTWMASVLNRNADRMERAATARAKTPGARVADTLGSELS